LKEDEIIFTLNYTIMQRENKQKVNLLIQLVPTTPNYGGKRWWFICPLFKNNIPCKRRAGKLYLPPGILYLGCRQCCDLTNTSCQESHQFDSFYLQMAMQHGMTVKKIKELAKKGWL